MDRIFDGLLAIHVACGFLSIASFWVPMLAKKGGQLHRQAGKAYVLFMWVVVVTAALLSSIRVSQGHYVIAAFLGYLSLITAHPLWYGIVILRYKQQVPLSLLSVRRALNLAIFVGGIGLIVWSLFLRVQDGTILLLIFGMLGLTAFSVVRRPLALAQAETSWIKEHIEGMVGTSIAAYTAFFAFGGRRFFASFLTDYWMVLPWVLPTILGTIAIRRMKRKWVKG
ncbi:MAG: hypothetical protein AAF433_20625 [Bacteroidota bacterium]